jgi:hypothetical protein
MAILVHEVWVVEDENGQLLESCVLAGPMGDDARRMLGPGAKLHMTFEAGSHSEAMTTYNRILNRGAYEASHERDSQPYSDEWLEVQLNGANRR